MTADLKTEASSHQHNGSKDGIIHRMTTSIHRQAVSDTERPAVILLFIQRNKYGQFKESQSMMKAIWHPETASITPQAQKQQSISLPMKDNLLQEQSGHNNGRCMQKKKKKLYTTCCYTFLTVLLTVRQRSFIVSKRRMRKRNISLGRTTCHPHLQYGKGMDHKCTLTRQRWNNRIAITE